MADDIYGPSVPYFQVKTVRQNVQHVEPIIVPNSPNDILYRYKNINLLCDLIHINGIGFLNTIYQHILFSMVNTIKIEN